MKRVLVTGGRDYTDEGRVFATLDALREEVGEMVLVHGACRTGADAIASRWASARGVVQDRWVADWYPMGRLERGAGPKRNTAMVNAGASLCIAFPGGRGTADCVAKARRAQIEVREVQP